MWLRCLFGSIATVSGPPVVLISATITVTFSRASPIETLRPMPLAAPVTSANRPPNSSEDVPASYCGFSTVTSPSQLSISPFEILPVTKQPKTR
uniref:Putative secreted protein n=1 Tax=Ixodes ricinus TaxID=34613 RepID=A0A6B0UCA0_IXORI